MGAVERKTTLELTKIIFLGLQKLIKEKIAHNRSIIKVLNYLLTVEFMFLQFRNYVEWVIFYKIVGPMTASNNTVVDEMVREPLGAGTENVRTRQYNRASSFLHFR